MAIMSLPTSVSDFEGEISHVVVAGNETLIFVKPSSWESEWDKINGKLQELAPNLQKITSLSGVKSGEIYVVKIKSTYERSYIIRRPAPESYSIYLIDKGMQCETQFGEIYEFPTELMEFGMFSCVCPVMVPSADQLSTYKAFVGHKCKCIVDTVSKSIVVMGFVRGKLLVENDGIFEDLQDIVFAKAAANRPGGSGIASAKLALTAEKDANGQLDDTSSSSTDSIFRRPHPKGGQKANFNGRASFLDKKDYLVSKKEKRDKHFNADYAQEYDKVKGGTLFNQTAYKQYEPEMLPVTVGVRFDKRDRMLSTFWVVNKKVFTAVERALKEVADKLALFPLLRRRGDDTQMRQTPCIVRARADTAYKSLYRAVPAQYDSRTKRFSIFLVDFGWFKWVLANDIIDISTMDKSEAVMSLPVAMIHCREDSASTLHAKDLSKGANCEIIIKGHAVRDVYTVDLVEATSLFKNRMDGAIAATGRENALSNMRETEVISTCKKLVTETCQRQLMTSIMMETLSIASRELAQQPQNFWPGFCPPPFPVPVPMMMPMPIPVMMPMAFPNPNLQGAGDNNAIRPENVPVNNFENGGYSPSNGRGRANPRSTNGGRSPRFQNNNSQPPKEWSRNDFGGKNSFGASAVGDKNNKQTPRSSCDDGLSWDLPPKYAKEHRTYQKNWDNSSPKSRLTGWEKAVAADRATRNQQDNNNGNNDNNENNGNNSNNNNDNAIGGQ